MQPKTAQSLLNQLDQFFASEDITDKEKQKLWDVLSALRGPDAETEGMKHATTSIIRSHALPEACRPGQYLEDALDVNYDNPEHLKLRQSHMYNTGQFNHFRHHALRAFNALGLTYAELNEPPKD